MVKRSKKLRIGVIFGGRSGEHEVSIASAQSVMQALDKNKYEVIPIGITKLGQWVAGDRAAQFLKDGVQRLPFKTIFTPDPTEQKIVTVDDALQPTVQNQLDVIFPMVHGPYGEDGTLQGLLELANIPYVGAGVLGSAAAMDKIIQKQLTAQAGIPSVDYLAVRDSEWTSKPNEILQMIEDRFAYPIFTKPANLGSSVGIAKCHNHQELKQGIMEALRYDRKCVVEQGIEKAREIEVALLGNDAPQASVPGEIISSNEFYDYDAKYVDGKSREVIPADLPQGIVKQIQEYAVSSFVALELSGMARADFLVDPVTLAVYLNEINTIPGFTAISMYPKLWQGSGMPYPQLLDRLIELAIERHALKNKLITAYQPKNDWYK